jgi:hypothetical protein
VSSEFATADKVTSVAPPQDAERALEHYHTDIEHYRQMTLRALSSLKAELAKNGIAPEPKIVDRATPESESLPTPEKAEPEEKQATRKSKGKKSESLSAWPESENDEEVETFNLTKKS